MRYNTELVSFTQDGRRVTATIRNRSTGTSSLIRADYLAACDGAHSQVRDALGVKTEGLGELDEHYIFVYFRADWGELVHGYEADAILIDQSDFRGFFLITDVDRGMLLIQQSPSNQRSAQTHSTERFRELVSKGLGKPDLAVEIVDVVHWQPAQLVAEHFQQGRVLLVGDAAHTMPPKLGLGVNTAIQSAQNLAWKLAAVLKGHASPQLLATYEAERHPVGLLASEQSLVGPAASLLTQGSDDKLLAARKRVPLFSLILGYRYRSQAVLSGGNGLPLPAQIELLRSQGNSWRCPARDCRTYGWSSTVSVCQRSICSMVVSSSSSVLVAGSGRSQHPRSQHHVGLNWSLIGSRQTGICWIGKMAGGRSSGCQLRVPCWSVPMALWPGAAPCRSILSGSLGRYCRPSSVRPCQINRVDEPARSVRRETIRVTDGSTPLSHSCHIHERHLNRHWVSSVRPCGKPVVQLRAGLEPVVRGGGSALAVTVRKASLQVVAASLSGGVAVSVHWHITRFLSGKKSDVHDH